MTIWVPGLFMEMRLGSHRSLGPPHCPSHGVGVARRPGPGQDYHPGALVTSPAPRAGLPCLLI